MVKQKLPSFLRRGWQPDVVYRDDGVDMNGRLSDRSD